MKKNSRVNEGPGKAHTSVATLATADGQAM